MAVLGCNEVRFNKVSSPEDRKPVGFKGMFWQFATGPAMANDQRGFTIESFKVPCNTCIRSGDGRFEQFPARIKMEQIGTELITNPQISVGGNNDRFNIKISSSQPALARALSNNLERCLVIRIRELYEALDDDRSISCFISPERRIGIVETQQIVGTVPHGAKSIVRQKQQ